MATHATTRLRYFYASVQMLWTEPAGLDFILDGAHTGQVATAVRAAAGASVLAVPGRRAGPA
jgi:flagellar biosynthesis regulator FlbT